MTQIPLVKDFMTTKVITLKPNMDIYEAMTQLLKHHISGAPVVDDERNLVGILSEKDCLRVFAVRAYSGQLPGGLVSDFMSEGFEQPLQIANNKHDVIAMKITDPRETRFENVGLLELEDAETGEVYMIDTSSREFRREFAAQADEDVERLKRNFQRINLDFINIQTDRSYIIPLINFFKNRGKRL